MLTATRVGGPKMTGAIGVLVAVASQFASYNADSEQDPTLEEQIASSLRTVKFYVFGDSG